jgi:hypothetical protein
LIELINIGLSSWDRYWGRAIIDVMVRRMDAGCELRYLPHATDEDHGDHGHIPRLGLHLNEHIAEPGDVVFRHACKLGFLTGVSRWN